MYTIQERVRIVILMAKYESVTAVVSVTEILLL